MREILTWIAESPKIDEIMNWCWNAVACLVVIGGVGLIVAQLMMAIK